MEYIVIGDKALDDVVSSIEEVYNDNPKENVRFRLIHVLVANRELIERISKLPIIIECQPEFLRTDINWVEQRLGKQRAKYAYAWKEFINRGVVVTSGSDSPVKYYNPFAGICAAVTRQNYDGKPESGWNPEQKFTVFEAVSCYTKNAAYSSFEENIKGTVKKNKLADFIIIDKDPFKIEKTEIKDIAVLKTYLGGRKVFER